MSTPKKIQPLGEMHGKLPPHDVEIEKVVLGALLLERNAAAQVMALLKPDMFYKPEHVHIFEAIKQLYDASLPIDIVTVVTRLRKNGTLKDAGGPVAISLLTDRLGSSANVEYHSRILIEHAIKRELITISSGIVNEAYEDVTDCFDLVEKAVAMLMLVNSNLSDTAGNYKSADKISMEAHEHYEKVKAMGGTGITGVPSGLSNVDQVTGGWQPGDLIILAARPGMGKTAFMMQSARNAAVMFKKPVGIVSLEMQNIGLMQRMQAAETGVNSQSIRKALLTDDEYIAFRAKLPALESAPLYIDETPGQSISSIRAKAHQLKQKHGIEMLLVDYLQLIAPPAHLGKAIREQQVSYISGQLKILAKELKIPVIALSQLSRKVDERSDKRPQLSDLRESGAIEQDADMICFLYRPDYYGIKDDGKGNPYADGYTELIIAKHRNGDLDDVKLKFINTITKFEDYSEWPMPTNTFPATDYSASLKANKDFEAPPTPTDDLPF